MLILLVSAGMVFLVGNLVRIWRIVRTPVPLRWELYPVPKGRRDRQQYGGSYFEETDWWTKSTDGSHAGEAAFMAREVLLLKSVWEGFRGLWLWSWLLHWGLYLYIVAVVLGLFSVGRHWAVPMALAACGMGFAGCLGVALLRLLHARLRNFSTRGSFANLALLGGIFGSGLIALSKCSTLGEVWRTQGNSMMSVHLSLIAVFLAYFPFTHMTHAYMKFFTWHRVRWNDAPGTAKDLSASMTRQSAWSAVHISGGTPASWAEVVADAGQRGSAKRA